MNASPEIRHVRQIAPGSFDEAVAHGITMVYFCEPWFAPCQIQEAVLERLAARSGQQATFVEINVDEARELAVRLHVDRIPTLLLFRDGELRQRLPGVQRESRLVRAMRAVTAG